MALTLAATSGTLILTASPSFAVGLTPVPTTGPAAGTNKVVVTIASGAFASGVAVEFNTTDPCPSLYTTPATTSVVVGTVTAFTGTPTSITVTVPTLTTASYNICAYSSNSTTAGTQVAVTTGKPYVAAAALTSATLSANVGGPGATITATDTNTAFATGAAVELSTASCAATYTAPSGSSIVAATVGTFTNGATALPFTVPTGLAAGTGYYVCIYTGSTAASSALTTRTSTAVFSLPPALALSASNGPTAGGNALTATATGTTFLAGTAVVFNGGATPPGCPSPYDGTTGYVAASVRVLSTTKLGFTVPSGVTTAHGPQYSVCVYSSSSSSATLLAQSTVAYTVATAAAISTISPVAGSSQGSTVITVTGTALSGITSATIAGVALTNITELNGGAAFTAKTPAHTAGGPYTLAVTTAGGTAILAAAFTYTNGINVVPNTSPNTKPGGTDLDVNGIGFSSLTFDPTAAANSTGAHVYLVSGGYDPSTASGAKTIAETTECINVLPISDLELICTMDVGSTLTNPTSGTAATAAAAANAVTDALAGNGVTTLTSASGAFKATDVFMPVTSTVTSAIPANTIITAVSSDGTSATINNSTGAAITTSGVTVAASRNVASVTNTSGAMTITKATSFDASDVGRVVTGTGVPPGSVITAASAGSITLNQATTSAVTSITIAHAVAVPIGTYTVTVVNTGAVNANNTDPTYLPSVICSGSTFTISDY